MFLPFDAQRPKLTSQTLEILQQRLQDFNV